MADAIEILIRNLVVIIFLTTIVDLFLPNGNLQPFVRMIMGLFVFITVLSPIAKFFDDNQWVDSWFLSENLENQDIVSVQGDLPGNTQALILEQYAQKIEQQVVALSLMVDTVEQCHAKVIIKQSEKLDQVAEIMQIHLWMVSENEQAAAERIKNILSNYYSLDQEKIMIDTEEDNHVEG